jgi:hypothetical protein
VVGEVYLRTVIWFVSPKKDVNRFDWDGVRAERCVLTWELAIYETIKIISP